MPYPTEADFRASKMDKDLQATLVHYICEGYEFDQQTHDKIPKSWSTKQRKKFTDVHHDLFMEMLRQFIRLENQPRYRKVLTKSYAKNLRVYLLANNDVSIKWDYQAGEVGGTDTVRIRLNADQYGRFKVCCKKYIVDTTTTSSDLVRSMSAEMFRKKIATIDGQKVTDVFSSDLTKARLARFAPLIIELGHFYRENERNPKKVNFVDGKGGTYVELIASGIDEFSPYLKKGGKQYQNYQRELRELRDTEMHLLIETGDSTGKKGPEELLFNNYSSVVMDITTSGTKTILLCHQIIMLLGQHSMRFPVDLRERWSNWPGRRSLHHELATGYSMNQTRTRTEISVSRFCEVIELDRSSQKPSRFYQSLESVLKWMMTTQEIDEYRLFQGWDNDKNTAIVPTENLKEAEYIRFHFRQETHPSAKGYKVSRQLVLDGMEDIP